MPGAVDTTQQANGSGNLFNSFISGLSGLAQGAGQAYQQFTGGGAATRPASGPVVGAAGALSGPVSSGGWQKWLPWAIGGVSVAILVVALLMRRRGR